MKEVYVLGIGQTIFGKHKTLTNEDLGAYAVNEALKDAKINPKDIQEVYCGRITANATIAQAIMLRNGVFGIPMYNVENACSSGSSAVDLLYHRVASGAVEVGIALGVESMSLHQKKAGGKGLLGTDDQQGRLGLTMPGFFSMMYERLVAERGATIADLCYPTIKNHKNSVNNPLSQYRKAFTLEEIMASPMIADPITTLQCCPQSDGSAAVILCSKEYYEKRKQDGRVAVRMVASLISSAGPDFTGSTLLDLKCMSDGAKKVYEMAGIGPEDLDLIELHDAFSGEELAAYEMLGICAPGDGVKFAREHSADIGGVCAVNPSGGLLSMGHPLGASGVRVVCDVARQLRGEAYGTQVPDAKVGLAQMMGGINSFMINPIAAGLHILVR